VLPKIIVSAIGNRANRRARSSKHAPQYFGRYYTSDTCNNGRRKTKAVKLCDKAISIPRRRMCSPGWTV